MVIKEAFASLLVRTAQICSERDSERKVSPSEGVPETFLTKRKISYLDLYIGISMKEGTSFQQFAVSA